LASNPEIGEFVLLEFPYTNYKGSKVRPGLVIGHMEHGNDCVVAFVSSEVDAYCYSDFAVTVEAADLASGTLKSTSVIRLDKTIPVHPSQFRRTGVACLNEKKLREVLQRIAQFAARNYSKTLHRANLPATDGQKGAQPFDPETSSIPYAGRVFDHREVEAAVGATLDFWLTLGKEGEAMEKELADFLGVKKSILVNSGSSANLVAFSALTSHKLPAEKRIRPGDEVITCAAGFPTTVTPIIQQGAVPVFIDNDPATGNADISQLEAAYEPGRTKAVMMAHALGNPFDLSAVLQFCKAHDLWLIEDNCDALGCSYTLPVDLARELGLKHLLKLAEAGALSGGEVEKLKGKQPGSGNPLSTPQPLNPSTKIPFVENGFLTAYTGSFGDLSTQSFYPPHHLTMGEGGAVNIVRDMKFKVLAESFRDWGRDCWCASGVDNTCNKRFGWQLGELPEGYDHKYIYSHLGYNLKPLDPQAAIGRQQLRKLPAFIQARKENWEYLRRGLADLDEFFSFSLPTHATGWTPEGFTWDATRCRTDCSWFGFLVLVRESAPFDHSELARALDAAKIGNRMLFGGNLVRQPAFVQLRKDNPKAFRVIGDLARADRIMKQALFLGAYPGLTRAMLDYEIETIRKFVRRM
jgi:CDP-6-deoxy-D-xylo-4-hexulose-3-dehydrase